MILVKPKPGDRMTWEYHNPQISNAPVTHVQHLVVLEVHTNVHVSTKAEYGAWMIIVQDKFGKVWPLASKHCIKES